MTGPSLPIHFSGNFDIISQSLVVEMWGRTTCKSTFLLAVPFQIPYKISFAL
jgi:hypothetical protein